MTKAATVAEAKRRKRRADRKDGPRWACGKLKTAEAVANDRKAQMDAMRPTLEHRCNLMGWALTDENLNRARDNRLGNPGGRAMTAGWFGADEFAALCEYRDIRIAWQAIHGAPWPHPRCCAWAREAASAPETGATAPTLIFGAEDTPERKRAAQAAIRERLAKADAVLGAAMVAVVNVMMADDKDEWRPMDHERDRVTVKLAAKALARHFGLMA